MPTNTAILIGFSPFFRSKCPYCGLSLSLLDSDAIPEIVYCDYLCEGCNSMVMHIVTGTENINGFMGFMQRMIIKIGGDNFCLIARDVACCVCDKALFRRVFISFKCSKCQNSFRAY